MGELYSDRQEYSGLPEQLHGLLFYTARSSLGAKPERT